MNETHSTREQLRADRQQFIDCVNGELLRRNASGVITHLGDAATAAVEAAERGERVWLTVRGKVVSYIENGKEYAINGSSSPLFGVDLEEALRFELRAAGIRWQPMYKRLGDDERRELYEKMRDRREHNAAMEEEMRRKRSAPEPDDEPRPHDADCDGCGTFNRGTGGGRRVIRSTRNLGG